MKNIFKMSLVAISAIASIQTSSLAAESLSDAFTNGKVNGQLKSYYFAKTYDGNTTKDASIWVNGLTLGYKTDSLYGFSLGTTAQFSSVTSIDDDSSKYLGTMDASGTVMSELYLQYKIDNTTMKAGRQFFGTPIVAGSGSRFIRQSFEGYSISNTDLPNTTIIGAYLNKFADRTDRAGEPGEFGRTRVGIDGTWTIYAKNNSIKNLQLQGQYADVSELAKNANNGYSILYFDAIYKFELPLNPSLSAQYLNTSYDAANQKDGTAYGLKLGISYENLSAYAAYTTVSDDNNVNQGVGSGAIPLYTNGETVDAWSATLSDTDAYKIGAAYKIGNATIGLSHSSFDRTGQKVLKETNLTVTYKANKNLTAQVQYSKLNDQYISAEKDINSDLRMRLIYSF